MTEVLLLCGTPNRRTAAVGVFTGNDLTTQATASARNFESTKRPRGPQNRPDVAILSDGDVVVTWEGRGVGDHNGIFMRRFSADGASDEARVNQTTSGDQSRPVVAAVPDGGIVFAWQGKGTWRFRRYLYASHERRAYLKTKVVSMNEKVALKRLPTIAVGADGQFVVAWKQSDGRGVGVHARQFGSDGVAGAQIVVNQTLKGTQKTPSAAYLADGRFAVSWHGRGTGDRWGTFTRTFHADGTPEAGESMVNTTVKSGQVRPATAAVNGGYVVAWQGRGIGDRRGVFARFFSTASTDPFGLDPIGNQSVDEGATVSFTPNVVDLDGMPDNITFALDAATAPAGATIESLTGLFQWTTGEADDGSYDVDVIASEGDFSVTRTVHITVNEVNQAPALDAISDLSTDIGQPISVSFSATDADLPVNNLTFTATLDDGSDLPAWMTFDASTQVLSGTPGEGDAGTRSITVTVSDEGGLSDSKSFTVTVVSDPFTLNVEPTHDVAEGSALSFVASTSGSVEAPTLTATGLPAGARL